LKPISAQLHLSLVTAKFGLTAFLAVLLAGWWVPKDVLSAAFVSLLCIQPTLVTGVRAGVEQLLASALGAVCTMGFVLLMPITPLTSGASIAVTYAIGAYMRLSPPAMVVALFSSLYMTLLAQDTPFHTALLRFQSVLLGVVVAIVMNAVFSPIFTKLNLAVRVRRSLEAVKAQLASLRAALVAREASALEAQLTAFQGTFGQLVAVKNDLADMRREFRLPWRTGRRSYGEVYFSDRCLRALELATHHAQDVAMAALRLVREGGEPADGALVDAARDAMQAAVDLLDLVEASRFDRAGVLVTEARAWLPQAEDVPASAQAGGLSPRLVMRFALIQLFAQLGELVVSAGWLEQARLDPDRAMSLAAAEPRGGSHASE
jgi:uncharacterized membrane protein YgaE (UPF0421/DUF939 family)